MDSLRGIPVEHKLETVSMPSTGTTSCHPKNWRCRSERNSALDNIEITHTVSKNQIQNYTVTLNTSLTRPTTRCHLNIPLSHFVSNTNKPKHHESCSTKSKQYSKLQIKNFRCCVVKAKFRNSFVLSSNRYKLVTPHGTFWIARQLKTIHNNTFRPTSSSSS